MAFTTERGVAAVWILPNFSSTPTKRTSRLTRPKGIGAHHGQEVGGRDTRESKLLEEPDFICLTYAACVPFFAIMRPIEHPKRRTIY